MRLGQLARKLEITQGEILNYLKEIDRTEIKNSNSKIDESLEQLLIEKYKPELLYPSLEETEEDESAIEDSNKPNDILENDVEPTTKGGEIASLSDIEVSVSDSESLLVTDNDALLENTEEPAKTISTDDELVTGETLEDDQGTIEPELEKESNEETSDIEEVEVIRVKKIKLEGIKVVGKIELPEPKIKEEQSTDEADSEATTKVTEKRSSRKRTGQRDKYEKRRNYKQRAPESYEQRLKREKREAELKHNRKHKKLKKKKKEHYIENVQSQVQIKPSKKAKKKIKAQKHQPVTPEKSKNLLRKFWGWLNGEFDQY